MMPEQDETFLKILLETFTLEAREHLDMISNGLLELENSEGKEEMGHIIETLFREAHSLKGAARSVNVTEIEEVCKVIEDVFGHYKKSHEAIPKLTIENLLESVDFVAILTNATPQERVGHKPKVRTTIKKITELLNATEDLEPTHLSKEKNLKQEPTELTDLEEKPIDKSAENTINETKIPESQTIRVPVKKLNRIMLQSEEMLFAKIISQRHIRGVQKILKVTMECDKEVGKGTLSGKELSHYLKKLKLSLLKEIDNSKNDARVVSVMVDRLLGEMKQALMLPFSTLFFALPKSVHDMAISVGKEAVLKVEGGGIEIDRRILEDMKDPLTHLLRNAVDHGIELPHERAKKSKPTQGLVTLCLKQESASQVSIIIRDDGAGIDERKLLESALKQGIIDETESKTLDSEDILSLIFKSGITTSKIVSDLSGRGLGLAIVQEKTQRLGGNVSVKNLKAGGSEFTITLPLTLSTFRGVLVCVDEHRFIFPSINVKRVMEVCVTEIKTIEGKETLTFEHQVIPFVLLRNILNISDTIDEKEKIIVAIIESGGALISVGIDEILYEDEVMVKSLGKQLSRVKNISGVALLSSDKPALILNIQDLFKSVGLVKKERLTGNKDVLHQKRRIMVVDDSPTTRILLKNVLEMAGYDIVTANDGLEAYEELKKSTFDLLVSDVEMPRMNGFELTASLREDKILCELPVVLITALESPEDKEKGMNAGANAYIIKSSFDQNNLMETIKWLIHEK